MQETPFDNVAFSYDTAFTNTLVGRAQRDMVWRYLDQQLPKKQLKILELNCGTGEDAVWLAKRGHHVTATDASRAMVDITRQKAALANVELQAFVWDFTTPFEHNTSYDLVFSNFGGLNCISPEEMHELFRKLQYMLSSEGMVICVVIGKSCPWEKLLFTLKGNRKAALRRSQGKPVQAKISETEHIHMWYYNSNDMHAISSTYFSTLGSKPIGLTIPPLYGTNAWWHIKPIIHILKFLEILFAQSRLFRNTGDHLYITLKKRAE